MRHEFYKGVSAEKAERLCSHYVATVKKTCGVLVICPTPSITSKYNIIGKGNTTPTVVLYENGIDLDTLDDPRTQDLLSTFNVKLVVFDSTPFTIDDQALIDKLRDLNFDVTLE